MAKAVTIEIPIILLIEDFLECLFGILLFLVRFCFLFNSIHSSFVSLSHVHNLLTLLLLLYLITFLHSIHLIDKLNDVYT